MKALFILAILSFLTFPVSLKAQNGLSTEEKELVDVFNRFFELMKNRDSTNLRIMIRPFGGVFFSSIHPEQPDMIVRSESGASLKGFFKSLGETNGKVGVGQCEYTFNDFEVTMYEGVAIVSAQYTCFWNLYHVANCGRYLLYFRKSPDPSNEYGYDWKVNNVLRILYDEAYCGL